MLSNINNISINFYCSVPAGNFNGRFWKWWNFDKDDSLWYSVGKVFRTKIWDTVPNNTKKCSSLNKFKNSIKSWKSNECPCRLCKKYIAQVGFIWFRSTFCTISEEKIENLDIFCIFWFFIYTLNLFIAQNGKVSPGFPVVFFERRLCWFF